MWKITTNEDICLWTTTVSANNYTQLVDTDAYASQVK